MAIRMVARAARMRMARRSRDGTVLETARSRGAIVVVSRRLKR